MASGEVVGDCVLVVGDFGDPQVGVDVVDVEDIENVEAEPDVA